MNTYRFGFIGLGNMAKAHVENLQRFSDFKLEAICDVVPESVDAFAKEYGIPTEKSYIDYKAMIGDPDVDVIVCVTPNHTHASIIKECIEAGKPFMAEKPFTRTYEEAKELMECFKQKPVPNMIGFSYRYHPQFRFVKELIESGKIGDVRNVFIQYLQGFGAVCMNTPMAWRFDKKITGTGTLGDLGSHMIDMARFLVGEFEDVSGRMATFVEQRKDKKTGEMVQVEVDDFTAFHANLERDVAGVFQTSRNAVGAGNQHEAYIYGDQGTLFVTSNKNDEITWMHIDPETNSRVKEQLAVPQEKGVDQWDEFMKMLRGEKIDLITTVKDGYMNQAVMEAIVVSDQERRNVSISQVLQP